jgi:hypothetical protein
LSRCVFARAASCVCAGSCGSCGSEHARACTRGGGRGAACAGRVARGDVAHARGARRAATGGGR